MCLCGREAEERREGGREVGGVCVVYIQNTKMNSSLSSEIDFQFPTVNAFGAHHSVWASCNCPKTQCRQFGCWFAENQMEMQLIK